MSFFLKLRDHWRSAILRHQIQPQNVDLEAGNVPIHPIRNETVPESSTPPKKLEDKLQKAGNRGSKNSPVAGTSGIRNRKARRSQSLNSIVFLPDGENGGHGTSGFQLEPLNIGIKSALPQNGSIMGVGDNTNEIPPLPPQNPSDMQSNDDNPKYLHGYFETMYMLLTSPYKTKNWREHSANNWLTWLSTYLQLAFVFIIVIWAMWESFNEAKFAFLYFMAGKGLSFFVVFSFHVFVLLTKLCSVYMLTHKRNDADAMLDSIEEYGNAYGSRSSCHCNHWKWIIFGICVSTLIFSGADTLFERGIEDWTPSTMLLEKSYDFSVSAFIWDHRDIDNKSRRLAFVYGGPMTPYTISFGLISIALQFASDYQMGTLRDLTLVYAFVMYLFMMNLMDRIYETMENPHEENSLQYMEVERKRKLVWGQLEKLKLVFKAGNAFFDLLLPLLHLVNLFLHGFFASLCIERNDYGGIIYAHYAFNILKAELTYLIASRISAQNDVIQQWIGNCAHNDVIIGADGRERNAYIVLREFERQPMGIGSGIFLINQSFHIKFLCLVGSLVLFLADEKNKSL